MSGFGNRVTKYEQRFCNSEFGNLKLSAAEVAVITTLLLRGAQTPGELRSRASRMYEFSDMAEVESTLENLATREDGPYVIRPAREPGKRESRYMHLFCGEVDGAIAAADQLPAASGDLQARVEMLETEVAELKQRLDSLLAHRETNVNKLRIGVVGLGGIAQKARLPVLGTSADWTLQGAFSPSRDKALRICDTGGYPTWIHW